MEHHKPHNSEARRGCGLHSQLAKHEESGQSTVGRPLVYCGRDVIFVGAMDHGQSPLSNFRQIPLVANQNAPSLAARAPIPTLRKRNCECYEIYSRPSLSLFYSRACSTPGPSSLKVNLSKILGAEFGRALSMECPNSPFFSYANRNREG